MIRAIHFIKRKPGMELDAFRAYWLGRHAELVSKVPGVRSYVQCHTLLSGYKKGEPIWDGIAELVYDDIDAMRRVADLPESRAANEDTGNFADLTPRRHFAHRRGGSEGRTDQPFDGENGGLRGP